MHALRVTIGIDPGVSGAIAVLLDGEPWNVLDIPTRAKRKDGTGRRIDATAVAQFFRKLIQAHYGAAMVAALERVGGRPGEGGPASFQFGQGDGILRGVLASHGIATAVVSPVEWKRHARLIDMPKDMSRDRAIELFPAARYDLTRKKDTGRAEALLIANWAADTEAVGERL